MRLTARARDGQRNTGQAIGTLDQAEKIPFALLLTEPLYPSPLHARALQNGPSRQHFASPLLLGSKIICSQSLSHHPTPLLYSLTMINQSCRIRTDEKTPWPVT